MGGHSRTLFGGGKIVLPPEGAFESTAIWQCVNDEQVQMLLIVGDAMATPLADTLEANPGRWNTSSLLMLLPREGPCFRPPPRSDVLTLVAG